MSAILPTAMQWRVIDVGEVENIEWIVKKQPHFGNLEQFVACQPRGLAQASQQNSTTGPFRLGAPNLVNLCLLTEDSAAFAEMAFPWSQLTHLTLEMLSLTMDRMTSI